MKMVLILLFMSDVWLDVVNIKNAKLFKKGIVEELIPIVWHPKRWWNFCMTEDEKKEIEPIFIE